MIATRSDWRLGIQILGGSLLVAALLRLILANRDAGMLAVRNRFLDCFLLTATGIALIALATSIPDMPLDLTPTRGQIGPSGRAGQIRPSSVTASRSSASSAVEASMRAREKASISRPWTMVHSPCLVVTGNEETRPSGTS